MQIVELQRIDREIQKTNVSPVTVDNLANITRFLRSRVLLSAISGMLEILTITKINILKLVMITAPTGIATKYRMLVLPCT